MNPLDRLQEIYAALPSLDCKRLCQECCGPICISELEYKRLQSQTEALPIRRIPLKSKNGHSFGRHVLIQGECAVCPILKNGVCSAYFVRPLICRIWGLTQTMRCPWG